MDCLSIHINKHRFNPVKGRAGFSLIEVMVSILIIMILATGAMGYQFISARDVKLSEVQTTATRLSLLLLESWKGTQGAISFDPVSEFGSELTIESVTAGPAIPTDDFGSPMILLGYYRIEVESTSYYITLSYVNETASEPMILNAVVSWRSDFAEGTLDGSEHFIQNSTYMVTY